MKRYYNTFQYSPKNRSVGMFFNQSLQYFVIVWFLDSQCGHGRCFECMFRYSECPICFNGNENGYDKEYLDHPAIDESTENITESDQFGRSSSNFASIHNRGCSRRSSDLAPRISAFSKESGFQSSYSSTSSVYSGPKVSKYSPVESASVSIYM